jgi:hypothetical protein
MVFLGKRASGEKINCQLLGNVLHSLFVKESTTHFNNRRAFNFFIFHSFPALASTQNNKTISYTDKQRKSANKQTTTTTKILDLLFFIAKKSSSGSFFSRRFYCSLCFRINDSHILRTAQKNVDIKPERKIGHILVVSKNAKTSSTELTIANLPRIHSSARLLFTPPSQAPLIDIALTSISRAFYFFFAFSIIYGP